MKSFKIFRQNKVTTPIIVETTVPDNLQHIAEGWNHHANLSDETHEKIAAATPGNTFTSFPLNNQNHNDVDADVAEHLTKHNYQVKDYTKGIATIKKQVGDPSKGIPMREKMVDEKIGSILDKTGASDDVKKSYMNDPARAASKGLTIGGGHHVVITHSPLGVSGMSTGTHWRDQSCMNQEGGGYAHHLSDDSENGTHVAYLVHHDDVNGLKYGEPDKPIARIAIKPFHEEENDHDSDTIFRPETKTYGSGNTSFGNAVGSWATHNYPAKSGVTYHKNSSVYDDTGNTEYKALSKEDVEHSVKNNNPIIDRRGASVDKEIIDHALSYGKKHISTLDDGTGEKSGNAKEWGTKTFINNMADIGNLNTQHVASLHAMVEPGSMAADILAGKHGDKYSSNAMKSYVEGKSSSSIPNKMLMNPKLPASIVDKLPTNKYSFVRRSMLKPEHYQKIIDHYNGSGSGSAYDLGEHHAYFNKDHIDNLANSSKINHSSSTFHQVSHVIMSSPHFTQEHHDKLVASEPRTSSATKLLQESKFASLKDVSKFSGEHVLSSESGISALSKNPHISSETAKHIKDTLVSGSSLGNSREMGGSHTTKGYGANEIPVNIGKHLTPEDHAKLADSGKTFSFSSASHSGTHLDTIGKLVTHTDDELGNHIEKMTKHHEDNGLDEYDHTDGEDEHANELVKKLHGHIENYALNIDNHIDHHVAEGVSISEVIKDHKQHDIAGNHLDKIDNLENYKTPENTSRYGEHEHWDDHVADIHDRMRDLTNNTEDRNNNDHDW